MKVIGHYEFSNDKALQTVFLSATDTETLKLPSCDSIGLRRLGVPNASMMVMRPDEALIMARMLIEAVWKTTVSYEVKAPN